MYRILIADDEPIERTVVAKTLQKYLGDQLEIVAAENGREAVQLFFEKDCQIALLDIEMPGVNGLEAAEQIRKQDYDASIIFLTAFDEFDYARRAIGVRAMDYLLKPTPETELIATIEEAMRMVEKSPKVQRELLNEQMLEEETNENVRLSAVTEKIRHYIDSHYKEDISLQDVAGAMNYSDAYFCKIFKQCFGKGFIVYLSEYRVEKAKELLSDVAINIKNVSQEVGYRDSNYFAKVFKRIVGETPTEYRIQSLQKKG